MIIFVLLYLAPGSYNVEKVVLDHGPAYSFGVKVKNEKYSDTPGKPVLSPVIGHCILFLIILRFSSLRLHG